MSYIPYSQRNNLEQGTELSVFLDYCERELGADIKELNDLGYILSIGKLDIKVEFGRIVNAAWISFRSFRIADMNRELFFLTYTTLLPNIRDLYSKRV